MYEGEPNEDNEELPPIFTAKVGDDGGLRGDWMDTAEYIADTEEKIALWWRHPASRGTPVRDGQDHLDPGFVLLGNRESLAFIGETASGITEHGQAFVAWARHVGGDPEELRRFQDAYLGRWETAEQFVSEVLAELGPILAEGPEADQQMRVLNDVAELAQELQRRGDIWTAPTPDGGVWVFRPPQDQSPQDQPNAKGRR